MTRGVYYNEFDPRAAAWLRALIARGLIPAGEVDERSIADVAADDLRGFTQHHFFAGIAGWSRALQLAGWPADRPIWTGSCPCQPFSVAGKGKGTADERHVWPDFFRLIGECRPSVVVGEQVASKAGREWLSGVFADMEGVGYAGAGADLCAAGVNAPHIRQRLYWVGVADAESLGRRGRAHVEDEGRREQPSSHPCEGSGDVADADDAGREGRGLLPERADERAPWSHGVEWRRGADGKSRRVKRGICLLAPGLSGGMALERTLPSGEKETHVYSRVGALRGFGNAIVPPLAAEFIGAIMEIMDH
jgi:DNA (cytosine-5)-methyltransferase 1